MMRKKAIYRFGKDSSADSIYRSMMMRQLIRLSEQGLKWREKQDEIDSEKGRVQFHPRDTEVE
jgi:hypothetical protein